jgi:hypothetical protein
MVWVWIILAILVAVGIWRYIRVRSKRVSG